MDISKPSSMTLHLPAGISDEVFAHIAHTIWSGAKVATQAAHLEEGPRISLGKNCPDTSFLQQVWEREGKESPWSSER